MIAIFKCMNGKDGDLLSPEKLDHLYSNHKFGHIANLVNATILVAIQWQHVRNIVLYTWLGGVALITLGRMLLVRQYHHQAKPIKRIDFWGSLFLVGVFASGVAWGAAGIFLFPPASGAHQMFTAFTIGGMVAGASATFCVHQAAFYAFSLPSMMPIIVFSLLFGDGIHTAMAVMLSLFLILMGATCYRNNKVTVASMKLRFENKNLVDYLSQAKKHTESVNSRLQNEINEREKVEVELENHQNELADRVKKQTAELRERNLELQNEVRERRRMERALRDSEELYRILVENAVVGIVMIRNHEVTFANSFISTISGYSIDEIVGSPFIDFVHPDDRDLAIANHMKRLKGEPLPASYPIRILDRKGEVHWLEVNAACMTYEEQPAILIFFRDITQQRKLEAQLLQSEKMASIGQLAAGVAHEINNPVGFVNSNLHTLDGYQEDIRKLITRYRKVFAAVMQIHADDRSQSEITAGIESLEALEKEIDIEFILEDWPQLIIESREGTERIKNIVLDLKNFAHPGKEGLQMTDINQSIESTLNIVWNELKYKTNVIKDYGEIPEIECYPQQLNQVFMNLLVNAGQAIEEKGEIRIRTRQNNGLIEIKINDTGCGIAEEDLNKIFDPFFTTKPVGKGTGLGLNVSYNIIKKHNGEMAVASKLGEGTTFTIQLPVF